MSIEKKESTVKELNIPGYAPKEGDFKKIFTDPNGNPEVFFGVCEVQGTERTDQQDAIVVSSGPGISLMSTMDEPFVKKSFLDAFEELQNDHANIDNLGATCVSTTAWIDTVDSEGKPIQPTLTAYTANLGDSVAFLVRVKADNTFSVQLLNDPESHKPSAVAEQERARNVYKKHLQERIKNNNITEAYAQKRQKIWEENAKETKRVAGLGVTRTFGNIEGEVEGTIHIPDVSKTVIELEKDERVYVVGSCDGLLEKAQTLQGGLNILGGILRDAVISRSSAETKLDYSEIAEKMVAKALEQKSRDNISCVICPLVADKPASLTILDGHGDSYAGNDRRDYEGKTGKKVAEDVGKAFYQTLEKKLEINSWPRELSVKTGREVVNEIKQNPPAAKEQCSPEKMVLEYQIPNLGKIFTKRMQQPSLIGVDALQSKESVAAELLLDIRAAILATPWKVGKMGGTVIPDQKGNKLNTFPKHVAEMLAVIDKAFPQKRDTENLGCLSLFWFMIKKPTPKPDPKFSALEQIVKIGKDAAKKQPFSIGGMGVRDKETQAFYDLFKDASLPPKVVAEEQVQKSSHP
ncbi:MAG: hypothetical protein H2069_01165 [Legionella sp.]|nr:hypothetical protein [Legionella sp.]